MTTSLIVLELGAIGLKVTKLQSALKQINFYFSAIDGVFGAKTKVAVIKFQQSYNHLDNNGIVEAETILQLDEAVWLSGKEILREGSTGDEVKALQEIFHLYNTQTLTIDGFFGSKTKEAVILFQKNWGLQADGIVRKATWAALYCHQVHNIPDEDRVNYFFGDLDRDTFIKLPLKKGEERRDVLILQKFLNYVSVSTPEILEDGIFANTTEQSVKNFQYRNGLITDGVVGIQTYDEMLAEGLNQRLIDELLSYRYGELLNFTQGKEVEIVEDTAAEGETVVHRFEVEPGQNFRIIIRSLENNAVFGLIGVVDSQIYAQQASNSQLFLEQGKYFINVSGISGNANYKLTVESMINC